MNRALCIAAVLALGTAGAWAGKARARKPAIRWATSWEDAVETARALNVPIIVHRHGFYWPPCWKIHRSVLQNKDYIRFSNENCVEVMAMQDQERALREKPKRAETCKVKDAYGDEVECYVEFPGITVDEMKGLFSSDALQYMEGPLMPYTAVVDPHSLETLGSIKRGEPTTVKTLSALVAKCRKQLTAKHGKGVARKLWDRVNEMSTGIDIHLGEGRVVAALEHYHKLVRLAARPPAALRTRIDAARDSVLEDAGKLLDGIEAGKVSKQKKTLAKLIRALEGTPLEERAKRILKG